MAKPGWQEKFRKDLVSTSITVVYLAFCAMSGRGCIFYRSSWVEAYSCRRSSDRRRVKRTLAFLMPLFDHLLWQKNTSLYSLELSNNSMGVDGAVALAGMLKVCLLLHFVSIDFD